jgi:hypothetical protein
MCGTAGLGYPEKPPLVSLERRFRFGGLRSVFESQNTPPGSKSVAPAAPVSNWALEIPSIK